MESRKRVVKGPCHLNARLSDMGSGETKRSVNAGRVHASEQSGWKPGY